MKPKNRISRYDILGPPIFPATHPPIPMGMGENKNLHIIQQEFVTIVTWSDGEFINNVVFNLESGLNSTWNTSRIRRSG